MLLTPALVLNVSAVLCKSVTLLHYKNCAILGC